MLPRAESDQGPAEESDRNDERFRELELERETGNRRSTSGCRKHLARRALPSHPSEALKNSVPPSSPSSRRLPPRPGSYQLGPRFMATLRQRESQVQIGGARSSTYRRPRFRSAADAKSLGASHRCLQFYLGGQAGPPLFGWSKSSSCPTDARTGYRRTHR